MRAISNWFQKTREFKRRNNFELETELITFFEHHERAGWLVVNYLPALLTIWRLLGKMRYILFWILFSMALQFAQQPKPSPTPIPQIKCFPIESNGVITGWNCVDLPPECVIPRKKMPQRPGVK